MEEKLEANKRKFQSQLEEVKAVKERRSRPAAFASTAQPPTFNGNTSWSIFRRQFETVAKNNHWSQQEKSTYLITDLKGRAADVLHRNPTNAIYHKTLQALEARFESNTYRRLPLSINNKNTEGR
jgi:hypothetical protein